MKPASQRRNRSLSWRLKSCAAAAALFAALSVPADEPTRVTIDFAKPLAEVRPLHGINKGPLAPNGLVDITEAQKRLRIPFTRLHDCHHPNPDVVDIHAVFPNPEADPSLPESYDFRATDLYISAIRATGAQVVYRLGESIEHQPVKRYVHPPRDPARWAAVCAGIVRHYNSGWAKGFHYDIPYWEVWNEPENRPVMWTGSDAQFLELYRHTVRVIRAEFPGIKIGGPSFGNCGRFDGHRLEPSEFCSAFLDLCQRESLPLDFFSWHCYTDSPAELAARARAIRSLLDERGFARTESHLNEWNLLPGNSWDVLSRQAAPASRQRGVDQMMGPAGAAFIAAALIELQDAPLNVANFYHGETGIFGLFTEVGAPTRNYYALLAFAQLLDTPKRVSIEGSLADTLYVLAATDFQKPQATILVANLSHPAPVRLALKNLPWLQNATCELRLVGTHSAFEPRPILPLEGTELPLDHAVPYVALINVAAPSCR